MTTKPPPSSHIAIIGAGLGGLTLFPIERLDGITRGTVLRRLIGSMYTQETCYCRRCNRACSYAQHPPGTN